MGCALAVLLVRAQRTWQPTIPTGEGARTLLLLPQLLLLPLLLLCLLPVRQLLGCKVGMWHSKCHDACSALFRQESQPRRQLMLLFALAFVGAEDLWGLRFFNFSPCGQGRVSRGYSGQRGFSLFSR